jgi:hypothetical protein
MIMPTIADYLKYANFQMAAEALLFDVPANKLKTEPKRSETFDFPNQRRTKGTKGVRDI